MKNFALKSLEIISIITPIGLIVSMFLIFLGKDKVRKLGIGFFVVFTSVLLSNSIYKSISDKPFFIPVEIVGTEYKPETIPLLTSETYKLVFKTEKNILFKGRCDEKVYYAFKKGDKVQIEIIEEPKDNTEIYITELNKDIKPIN